MNQIIPKCINNHLHAIIHAKLVKDIANVNLDRVLAKVQSFGNFRRAASINNEL